MLRTYWKRERFHSEKRERKRIYPCLHCFRPISFPPGAKEHAKILIDVDRDQSLFHQVLKDNKLLFEVYDRLNHIASWCIIDSLTLAAGLFLCSKNIFRKKLNFFTGISDK